jgi:hypothetical protein
VVLPTKGSSSADGELPLPTISACFNRIRLQPYQTEADVLKKVNWVIDGANKGHDVA